MGEQLRKSRFIMGISHDLRTPLALIKGYTEAISDGMVEDPKLMNSSLEIIRQKSQQLDDMIEDLISFVKLDTEEWRKNIKPLNGAKIFNDYFNRLYSDGLLLGRRITGKITLPDDLVILCDEKVLLRVLENLTGNALRYTKEGGFVEEIDSLSIGHAAMLLGAGRSRAEDNIDFAAGIYLEKKVGDEVAPGEVLARAYSNKGAVKEALAEIEGAYVIAAERPPVLPLIREYIEA